MSFYYDEYKGLATDFHDPDRVANYDAQQGTKIEEERQLVQELGIQSDSVVIEFGSGTGAFSRAASEVAKTVYSIDISKAMLAHSSKLAESAGITNIKFHNAGFLTYQHQGLLADFVVTKFAFHHLPDFWKAVALQRICTFMKPKGIFYLEDVIFSMEVSDSFKTIDDWIEIMVGSGSFSQVDFEGHVRDEHSTFDWILDDMFYRTGYTIIQKRVSAPTYANYLARKRV